MLEGRKGWKTEMARINGMEAQGNRRRYMIALNRWRSGMALLASVTTLLAAVFAIVRSLLEFVPDDRAATSLYQFLTPNANTLTALASAFIIPYTVEGMRKKRFTYPKWVALLHYSGTICTTLVMVFSVCVMSLFDSAAAFGGYNFQLHIICPSLVLASFFMVERDSHFTPRDSLICMIPVAVYALVYTWQVVVVGFDRGGWNDFYHLTDYVPIYVSAPSMLALALGISVGILKISNRLLTLRRKRLTALWTDGVRPVQVKIEMFGLGRYTGENGDESEIPIPMDIIAMLAERYGIETEALLQIYTRGVLDGYLDRQSAMRKKSDS